MLSKQEFWDYYDALFPQVYRSVLFRVSDDSIAQDLTSQVFFKALKNIKSFDPQKAQFSTWIYSIASHVVIDFYRKNKNTFSPENIEEKDISYTPEYSKKIDKEIDLNRVHAQFHRLSPLAREIILLRFYEEKKFDEIAQILSLKGGAVKMQFRRAIETLRKNLEHFLLLFMLLF